MATESESSLMNAMQIMREKEGTENLGYFMWHWPMHLNAWGQCHYNVEVERKTEDFCWCHVGVTTPRHAMMRGHDLSDFVKRASQPPASPLWPPLPPKSTMEVVSSSEVMCSLPAPIYPPPGPLDLPPREFIAENGESSHRFVGPDRGGASCYFNNK